MSRLGFYVGIAIMVLLWVGSRAEARTFPTYGNVCERGQPCIGDCTFAAAADWEILTLGFVPSEQAVIDQFHQAGGDDEEGLAQAQLNAYWLHHGIAGVRVRLTRIPWRQAVRYLRRRVPLIAGTPTHELVLSRLARHGVVAVTWGEELVIPWKLTGMIQEVFTGAVVAGGREGWFLGHRPLRPVGYTS